MFRDRGAGMVGGVRHHFGQRGLGAIAAIFILVVLAALGAGIASLSSSQHAGAALDLQGARALLAARSGIQYGLFQASGGTCAATGVNLGPLDGLRVTVRCAVVSATDADTRIYRITAIACNLPAATGDACPGNAASSLYVERHLEALAEM